MVHTSPRPPFVRKEKENPCGVVAWPWPVQRLHEQSPKVNFSRGREPGRAAPAGRTATNASLFHMQRSIGGLMVSMDGRPNGLERAQMFPFSN